MAEAARRYGSGLGADVARRLIARPIQRQATRPARPAVAPRQSEPVAAPAEPIIAPVEPVVAPDLTRNLEAQIRIMKAVLAAERRENQSLRACIGMNDEDLGEEARVVRDRWAGLVDKLLHVAV